MKALMVAAVLLLSACGESKVPAAESIETVARNTCWDAIENSAANKSSVDFHSFSSPPVVRNISGGRVEVFVKFSAKNSFGSESTSIARCILSGDGKSLVEITSQDSR